MRELGIYFVRAWYHCLVHILGVSVLVTHGCQNKEILPCISNALRARNGCMEIRIICIRIRFQ
jgi:hypothetical protein